MTDRIAIIVGILLLGAIAYDIFGNGGQSITFLARKGIDLIEWLAFWR